MQGADQTHCPGITVQLARGDRARRRYRAVTLAIAAGILGLLPALAVAVPACGVTVTNVAFPTYDVFATTNTVTTGSVKLSNCPRGATVALSKGTATTYDPRRMWDQPRTSWLEYNLFLDAGYTRIWGDGTGGSTEYLLTVTGNALAIIYARIPAGQEVAPGTYADSVVVTVTP